MMLVDQLLTDTDPRETIAEHVPRWGLSLESH